MENRLVVARDWGGGRRWLLHKEFLFGDRTVLVLTVAMVTRDYTSNTISENRAHASVHAHTQVPVRGHGLPAPIPWFLQCAKIMGDIIIIGNWVKGTQEFFVLFLQLFVSPTLLKNKNL